jgi:hypothetical protein
MASAVSLTSNDVKNLAATGAGRCLLGGYKGCTAETTFKVVVDLDGRPRTLANPANFESLATTVAVDRSFGAEESGAARTVKMKNSFDVAFRYDC